MILMPMIATMSLMMATLFMSMSHPMAMGLTLLIQTTLVAAMSGMITQSYWFSYILFLIFMGGMMVLFIYVASLSPNEMFSLSNPYLIMGMTPIIMTIMMTLDMTMLTDTWNFTDTMTLTQMPSINTAIMKIYTPNLSIMMVMMITYLFLTLIVVVKITNLWMGPLRMKK
uniref:NADH-ubiquinone oxidoreductase chain 6 n=1 Tax=Japyx solifugus TaxID=296598 RepID=Q4G2Z5_JAPSO|nr:NADH dehydrogenase subunit 6 [Japyx solifugus]AAV33415.1 NADH dehydrogenase subunit 6 [Japyx solifugus]